MSAHVRHQGTFKYELVVKSIWPDATLIRVERLSGGVSALVTRIDARNRSGTVRSCVVRQHGVADLTRNPNIASDEFTLLTFLLAEGLPVPEPLMVVAGSEESRATYLVTSFVEGSRLDGTVLDAEVASEMAETLSSIHSIDAGRAELGSLGNASDNALTLIESDRVRALSAARDRAWWNALDRGWSVQSRNPAALLHGDFWPGNLLWNGGSICAVLDWEDAVVGDPLVDVANCSLELYLERGPELASHFVHEYSNRNPRIDWTHFVQWQLLAAARLHFRIPEWGLATEEQTEMLTRVAAFADARLLDLGSGE
ncbi:hypothetical protein BH23CHL5_BH23CHL5_11330 [soil metagenome]